MLLGAKYDGEWRYDMKHGRGVLTDQTGRYTGGFKDDKPHGKNQFFICLEVVNKVK